MRRHCPVALHFNYLDILVVAREAEGPPLPFPQRNNCHECLRIGGCRRWLATHLLGSKSPVPLILLLFSTPLIVFISVPHLGVVASVVSCAHARRGRLLSLATCPEDVNVGTLPSVRWKFKKPSPCSRLVPPLIFI